MGKAAWAGVRGRECLWVGCRSVSRQSSCLLSPPPGSRGRSRRGPQGQPKLWERGGALGRCLHSTSPDTGPRKRKDMLKVT